MCRLILRIAPEDTEVRKYGCYVIREKINLLSHIPVPSSEAREPSSHPQQGSDSHLNAKRFAWLTEKSIAKAKQKVKA